MIHLLLSVLVAQAPATEPMRPPDGTYTYSISQGAGPIILTSTVVVKSDGATFDVSESVKLPNGQMATTVTAWDAATLLPKHYTLHQGDTINLEGAISPASIKFTGVPLAYVPIAGTKFMLVSDGLNSFRMMVPFVVAAHPGESFTVAQINGNQTARGAGSSASPPPNGPAGDATVMYTIDKELVAASYNPQTHVVDRMLEVVADGRMQLVKYEPAKP